MQLFGLFLMFILLLDNKVCINAEDYYYYYPSPTRSVCEDTLVDVCVSVLVSYPSPTRSVMRGYVS